MGGFEIQKFDKAKGTGSGHSLATFLQYILQRLGSSFTLSAMWAICPNGTDVRMDYLF